MMCYSYAMGMNDDILSLRDHGFAVERDGANFTLAFAAEKAAEWEKFVSRHLTEGYWNEYLTDTGAVFLFQLKEGLRRYEVMNFEDDEVHRLCETFCGCKLPPLRQMLEENPFYKTVIKKEKSIMIDSHCGLHCTTCEYKVPCNCEGCIETKGNPFHGECPVAKCCIEKGLRHCGECPEIPCALLTQYSCDPEHGDTPVGARIAQCRMWASKD